MVPAPVPALWMVSTSEVVARATFIIPLRPRNNPRQQTLPGKDLNLYIAPPRGRQNLETVLRFAVASDGSGEFKLACPRCSCHRDFAATLGANFHAIKQTRNGASNLTLQPRVRHKLYGRNCGRDSGSDDYPQILSTYDTHSVYFLNYWAVTWEGDHGIPKATGTLSLHLYLSCISGEEPSVSEAAPEEAPCRTTEPANFALDWVCC
jgi:hypothetical protein